MKLLILVLALIAIVGCATRQTILTTPAVSMNEKSFPKTGKTTKIGPVTSRYCFGEESSMGKKDQIGLMDEVIYRAQKEKNASYISDAQFFREGKCVVLEGIAMKVDAK